MARHRWTRRSSMWSPKLMRVSEKKSSGSMFLESLLIGKPARKAHGGWEGQPNARRNETLPGGEPEQLAGGGATVGSILSPCRGFLKAPSCSLPVVSCQLSC